MSANATQREKKSAVPSEQHSAQSTQSSPVKQLHKHRAVFPAVLSSAICHLALLLLLALVAYGGGADSTIQKLVFQPIEEQDLNVVDTFEVEPAPVTIEPEELEVETDFKVEMELETPEKMVEESLPEEPVVETMPAGDQIQSTLAEIAATPVSRIATKIQNRVSKAGGRKGEVQFALAWTNVNDLDLHIVTPHGERISHLRKSSICGGMLDVDMNVRGESEEPVENVRWLSNAPSGRYTVIVNLFRIHRPRVGGRLYQGSKFELLAQLGDESTLETSTASKRKQVSVFRFKYVPSSVPSSRREQLLLEMDELQEQEEAAAVRLLDKARDVKQQSFRDRLLNSLIARYPHSDAAIDAMRLLGGNITKNGF